MVMPRIIPINETPIARLTERRLAWRQEQIQLAALKLLCAGAAGFPHGPHPLSRIGKIRGFAMGQTPKLKSKYPLMFRTGLPGSPCCCPPCLRRWPG